MSERHPCIVPGCRRTHKPVGYREWICAVHWRGVPKATRRAYQRAQRRKKSREALDRLWDRCKRLAINEALLGMEL